ncbi:MAG: prepilin-type N-terminal cleavage/methylation domain-containing protein [Candidatus Brocadiia bacterium]
MKITNTPLTTLSQATGQYISKLNGLVSVKSRRSENRPRSGFTLIEIMVALALMAMLMVIIATIFSSSSKITTDGYDMLYIYSTARAAVDYMVKDINGCLPLEGDQQRFELGEDAQGTDESAARDWLQFRATAQTKDGVKGVLIKYYLAEETDPTILGEAGSTAGAAKTVKSKSTLYVLNRKTSDFDGSNEEITAMCHYILSFNIEFFDTASKTYKQLKESKFDYPIGDAKPEDEKLPRGLRFILQVVASAAERKSRAIIHEVYIPMGQ